MQKTVVLWTLWHWHYKMGRPGLGPCCHCRVQVRHYWCIVANSSQSSGEASEPFSTRLLKEMRTKGRGKPRAKGCGHSQQDGLHPPSGEAHADSKCLAQIAVGVSVWRHLCRLRRTFRVTLVSESQDKNKYSSEAIKQFSKEAGFETGDWESGRAAYLERGPTACRNGR